MTQPFCPRYRGQFSAFRLVCFSTTPLSNRCACCLLSAAMSLSLSPSNLSLLVRNTLFRLRPLRSFLVHPPAQTLTITTTWQQQQKQQQQQQHQRNGGEPNGQEIKQTYVALQGALEDELLSHLAVPFWLIRGGSMGEWGSFFTVPLRGSEIVKGTMRRQATRSRNSGNFCAAENRVGRHHSQLRSLGGGVGCRLGAVASKCLAHTAVSFTRFWGHRLQPKPARNCGVVTSSALCYCRPGKGWQRSSKQVRTYLLEHFTIRPQSMTNRFTKVQI